MNLKAGSLRKTDKTDKPVGRPMRKKERRHKLSISGTEEVTLVWILQILKREKEIFKWLYVYTFNLLGKMNQPHER